MVEVVDASEGCHLIVTENPMVCVSTAAKIEGVGNNDVTVKATLVTPVKNSAGEDNANAKAPADADAKAQVKADTKAPSKTDFNRDFLIIKSKQIFSKSYGTLPYLERVL